VALGHQDVDPAGLTAPAGMTIVGASSDHLLIDAGATRPAVGSEITFGLNYSALVRAMTSPFVARRLTGRQPMSDSERDADAGVR
jgi:predicted amino acid racemase